MQILFIHQNFPGQYRYLARHFAEDPDWDVYAIGEKENVKRQLAYVPKGIKLMGYEAPRIVEPDSNFPTKEFGNQYLRAQTLGSLLARQIPKGLDPDVICCHPGWGEGLFLREFFPRAKLIYFFEFFFDPAGALIGFDKENPKTLSQKLGYRVKNAINMLSMDIADAGISPTRWQWQTHPKEYHEKIRVIHDGVDTDLVKPNPSAKLAFPNSKVPDKIFTAEDEIITFSVRNLEPSRGFDRYMRALPRLQTARPKAWFLIVGGDEKSYVKEHESGKSWREVMLEEVGDQLDMSRILFLGRLPYKTLLDLFSISSLHIYMTIPFVLSWSMLEVMACSTPVLGSRTPPVEEVISDGENGFLFDYFSEDDLVKKATYLMENPAMLKQAGDTGRKYIVEHYDLRTRCLPQHLELINQLVGKV